MEGGNTGTDAWEIRCPRTVFRQRCCQYRSNIYTSVETLDISDVPPYRSFLYLHKGHWGGYIMAELMKELSTINGVSGNEDKGKKKLITEKISDKADEITVDALGNVIALKKAKKRQKNNVYHKHGRNRLYCLESTDKGYLKIKKRRKNRR